MEGISRCQHRLEMSGELECLSCAYVFVDILVQKMNIVPMKESFSLKYKLFKLIYEHPDMRQRELAHALGLSLGKVNYCLKALVDKGFVKAENFRNSSEKMAYAYVLTPKGIEEKIHVTYQFYRRTEAEYEMLRKEISLLQDDAYLSDLQKER